MPLVLHYELSEDHAGHYVEIQEKNKEGVVRLWRVIEGVSYREAKSFYDLFDDMVLARIEQTSVASYGHE